jgi:hypothetical protein
MKLTRRDVIASAGAVGLAGQVAPVDAWAAPGAGDSMASDPLRARIALSDLRFTQAAGRSEEGIPIGNGRMGSLVWTTPSQLRFQINRVDVYAADSSGNSLTEAHDDYCGGCAFVDIAFAGAPFAGPVQQHLSVYDGMLTITGDGVSVAIVPSRSHDAFAIAIRDRRPGRARVRATLRMLRVVPGHPGPGQAEDAPGEMTMRTRSHLATSRLHDLDGAIALSQHFSEGAYRASSAVALRFAQGAGPSELLNDAAISLSGPDAASSLVLIGSAASRTKGDEIVAAAREQADAAAAAGFADVAAATRRWWHSFWREGSIALRSDDGAAQDLQRGYHYFLYLMASTSMGSLPPKFNGMLWSTAGDRRAWGAIQWFTNTSCFYEALPASGRFDLMDPFFAMYSSMLDKSARAARDQWGSQGVYIAESCHFDGDAALPPAIAAEMRALYLRRKPWEQRSAAFLRYADTRHPYTSTWNWKRPGRWEEGRYVYDERGDGPYGPTSHMFAPTAKIAYLFWQRFEYTRDRAWLKQRAYPMLRGAVEFYRHHPLVSEGADGLIHIAHANNSEPVRGARDTNEDMSAMRGVTSALIRAATILNVDTLERAAWQAFLAKLAPLPTSKHRAALNYDGTDSPAILASGLGPSVRADPLYLGPDPNSLPTWFFDLCAVESRDTKTRALARNSFAALLEAHGPISRTWNGGLSKLPIAAAMLGNREAVRTLIPAQMNARPYDGTPIAEKWHPLRNRLNLGEGPHALSAQHLGRASEALHLALLQSNPPAPGEEPILHLFPAWPAVWDADFALRARGGFTVRATIRRGKVDGVEIDSGAGVPCRLRNPFGEAVRLARDGADAERLTGDLLTFTTAPGERISLRRA